jgi:hypothetical protein
VTTGSTLENYLVVAFNLYRNYDGQGSTVGDTTVYAQTSDVEHASVYAFGHSTDPTKMEVVAIDKTSSVMPVTFQIASAPALSTATAYELVTAASAADGGIGVDPAPAKAAPEVTCAGSDCTVTCTLPALSASTIVLR